MQLARTVGRASPPVMPEQGSTTSWSKRDGVPNNSPMLGRAEALRPAAAEQQVLDRLPVDAGAERRRRARGRIIGIARRAGQLEAVEEGRVAEQRQPQLGIGLVDVVAARGRQRRDVGAEAGGDDRIGVEAAALVAMLDADGDAGGAAGQVEQAAGQVGGEVPEPLAAAVALGEGDDNRASPG